MGRWFVQSLIFGCQSVAGWTFFWDEWEGTREKGQPQQGRVARLLIRWHQRPWRRPDGKVALLSDTIKAITDRQHGGSPFPADRLATCLTCAHMCVCVQPTRLVDKSWPQVITFDAYCLFPFSLPIFDDILLCGGRWRPSHELATIPHSFTWDLINSSTSTRLYTWIKSWTLQESQPQASDYEEYHKFEERKLSSRHVTSIQSKVAPTLAHNRVHEGCPCRLLVVSRSSHSSWLQPPRKLAPNIAFPLFAFRWACCPFTPPSSPFIVIVCYVILCDSSNGFSPSFTATNEWNALPVNSPKFELIFE